MRDHLPKPHYIAINRIKRLKIHLILLELKSDRPLKPTLIDVEIACNKRTFIAIKAINESL
jgi:hypothetical protein